MFDSRYGRQVNSERTQLVRVVTGYASAVATLLDENPVRGKGSYPLLTVTGELARFQHELYFAVHQYPLALAVDTDGRPDPLGEPLAILMANLTRVVVFYRNLTDLPDHLRSRAQRELSGVAQDARAVLNVAV